MRKINILLVLLFLSSVGLAQSTYQGIPSMTWPKLYKVTYTTVEDEYGEFEKPIFSETVKKMASKTITVEGYIMPFDGSSSKRFILTSLPINACFFCGNGGPESVMQIEMKTPITYTEKPIEVRGKLVLNDSNPDEMIYLLQDTEFLGVLDF